MTDVQSDPLARLLPGCSLADAAWRYAVDLQTGRRFLNLFWRGAVTSPADDMLTVDEAREHDHLRNVVEAALLSKLGAGELVAYWHPLDSTQPQRVAATWWSRSRMDLRLNQAEAHGTVITGIMVVQQGGQPTQPGLQKASKDKGGAPPNPGWPAFIAEVVRYADLDGIKSKRELNRHMKNWCVHNWLDAPDESTMRRKVAKLCPHAPP